MSRTHLAATAVLFGLIGWAYHPSAGHGPRGDQWCFLLDTIDQEGFLETLARTYSYNRTRVVAPGDYQLFRPVLFALLSLEKALFGTNFAAWQWVGVGLHCLAVYLLLRILLLVHDMLVPAGGPFTEGGLLRALAYGLALFFGLNCAVVEMVIWSHINGYLLFVVFALGALLLALKLLAEPDASPLRRRLLLSGAFLLVLAGAFTYEIGQFYGVAVGAVLGAAAWRGGRPGRACLLFALFAAVLPLYQGINYLDRLAHPGAWDESMSAIAEKAVSAQSLEHARRYVLYTVTQPFFPSLMGWEFRARVVIPEPALTWENLRGGGWPVFSSLAVLAIGAVLAVRGLYHLTRERGKAGRLLVVLLPLSLFVLHATVTVLGRMNLRPSPVTLSSNSYYAYLPLLAVLASLYVVWTWAASGTARRALVVAAYLPLLAGLAVLSVFGGLKTRAVNVQVKNALRPLRIMTKTLDELVRRHGAEPGFSFALDGPACAAQELFYGVPLPVILFKRYLNNHDPRYLVTLKGGKLVAAPADGLHRKGASGQIVADLVRVDTFFNFFFFDGWYYGVPIEQGYFRPERAGDPSVIKDRTLEGVRRQVPGKLAALGLSKLH